MRGLRIVAALLALFMAAAIIYGVRASGDLHPNFVQSIQLMTSFPWGQVTLIDLYVSFFLLALVIFFTERTWWQAALWIAPLPFLGSMWAAVWFAWRLPHLAQRLSRPDWPAQQ